MEHVLLQEQLLLKQEPVEQLLEHMLKVIQHGEHILCADLQAVLQLLLVQPSQQQAVQQHGLALA